MYRKTIDKSLALTSMSLAEEYRNNTILLRQQKAEKVLPALFLNTLKRINKAVKNGEFYIVYNGLWHGFFNSITDTWNESSIELLKLKLEELEFKCEKQSAHECGDYLRISWKQSK